MTLINAAASARQGTVSINYQMRSVTMDRIKSSRHTKAITLDQTLDKKKVGLIKIDVEGFEEYVINGAKSILARDMPELFIEAQTRQDREGLEKLLKPFGYKAVRVFNASPTYHYSCRYIPAFSFEEQINKILLKLMQFRILRRA